MSQSFAMRVFVALVLLGGVGWLPPALCRGADDDKPKEAVYEGKTLSQWMQALKDEDLFVRLKAARALGDIGPPAKEAVPVLSAALKDENLSVRFMAARSLGRIGSAAKEAVPALYAVLKEDSESGQIQAALAL